MSVELSRRSNEKYTCPCEIGCSRAVLASPRLVVEGICAFRNGTVTWSAQDLAVQEAPSKHGNVMAAVLL